MGAIDFKPAYLIHGDDHGRISERRAALRALAERESGTNGVECFEGDHSTPDIVAGALAAMTFAIGRRFLIVDGVERWKDADIARHLLPSLASIGPETTIAFFAREDGRLKVSAQLAKAVEKAGGSVAVERTLKAKELPKWLQGEAKRLGVTLDRDAAQALVGHVGDRQQRLLRELEKLALELGPGRADRRRRGRRRRGALRRAPGLGARRHARRRRRGGDDARLPRAGRAGRVARAARAAAGPPRARGAGDRPAPGGRARARSRSRPR